MARLVHFWPVVVLLVIWHLWVTFGHLNSIVAPSPVAVIGDILGAPGTYVVEGIWTVTTAVLGLLAGTIAGVLAAILAWTSRIAAVLVTPTAVVLQAVPVTAMIPIIARVFGYSEATIVAIAAIISFFPVYVLSVSGLNSATSSGRDVLHVLGASRRMTLALLHLPYAVPSILTGLRITAPVAILAAMLAEFLTGTHGLGHLFATARSYMDTERSWGAALVAAIISVGVFVVARALERRVSSVFT